MAPQPSPSTTPARNGRRPRSFVVERVERQPKQALPVARIWNRTTGRCCA